MIRQDRADDFFAQKKMSDFLSLNCFYRQDRETSKHVIIHCVKHSETHEKLEINEQINLKKIMFSSEKIKKITT